MINSTVLLLICHLLWLRKPYLYTYIVISRFWINLFSVNFVKCIRSILFICDGAKHYKLCFHCNIYSKCLFKKNWHSPHSFFFGWIYEKFDGFEQNIRLKSKWPKCIKMSYMYPKVLCDDSRYLEIEKISVFFQCVHLTAKSSFRFYFYISLHSTFSGKYCCWKIHFACAEIFLKWNNLFAVYQIVQEITHSHRFTLFYIRYDEWKRISAPGYQAG